MILENNKELNVDLSNTLYDSLKIPERDEDIVIHIEYVKKCLENYVEKSKAKKQKVEQVKQDNEGKKEEGFSNRKKEEASILEKFAKNYILRLEEGLAEFRKNNDMSKLLTTYYWVDIMLKKADLKVLEKEGKLTNREVNEQSNKYSSEWAIISNPEYRKKYDAELLRLRRIEYSDNVKVDLNNTLYKQVGLSEDEKGIIDAIRLTRKNLLDPKYLKSNEMLRHFSSAFVSRIEEALQEYYDTKNISALLTRYAGIDIMMKKFDFDLRLEKTNHRNALIKEGMKLGEPDFELLSKDEYDDEMKKLTDTWKILSNPSLKKIYDHELAIMHRIQSIKDESDRKKVHRNQIVYEEIRKHHDITTFDRSALGGDKARKSRFDDLPPYDWSITEYPGGKKLIMTTNTIFKDHPELDEKVEVYAHGEFRWGTMLKRDETGNVKPTYEDELCEVISIRKIDKQGNETVTYGIAQTRDLGYLDKMTEAEIRERERSGSEIILISTPEEIREREHQRRLEELRKRNRRHQPAYKVVKVKAPTSFGEKLVRFNRFLDTIGMEIPDMFIPKVTIEKRVPIVGAAESIKEFVPRTQRDSEKKYNVLVMQPTRYKLDTATQSEFAKIRLSDYALRLAKEKNGHFVGVFTDKAELPTQRLIDETIRACQFATVNPGYVKTAFRTRRYMPVSNIEEALQYIERRDKYRQEQRKAIVETKGLDTIDFYGE